MWEICGKTSATSTVICDTSGLPTVIPGKSKNRRKVCFDPHYGGVTYRGYFRMHAWTRGDELIITSQEYTLA